MSDLYWNTRKALFSVRSGGLVVDHVASAFVIAPKFVVREAGRQTVIRTGQKNVHAFVRGEVLEPTKELRTKFSVENRIRSDYSFAVYDPYDECGCFRVLCVVGDILIREGGLADHIVMLHAYVHNGKPQLKVKMS